MTLDISVKERIDRVCKGWATVTHWAWQQQLLGKVTSIRRVCMLGVYMGRDVAYMAANLADLREPPFHITAVDLFSEEPCADWPEEKRGQTWEEAGFGSAPQLEVVRQNLESLGLGGHVTLVKQDGAAFLRECGETFDLIYIDTSHDYETTRDTILAALPRVGPTGILAGDDFSDEGTWGVKKAVTELCPEVREFQGWIWFAPKALFNVSS